MIIFGRTLLSPVMIHKTSTYYGSKPDLCFRFDRSVMIGTMRTVSYTIEIETKQKKWQYSLVWRPSVTAYWWKDSKKKRSTT